MPVREQLPLTLPPQAAAQLAAQQQAAAAAPAGAPPLRAGLTAITLVP